jgi:hypothetical protein
MGLDTQLAKFLTYWRGGRRMGFGGLYLLWWWLFRR